VVEVVTAQVFIFSRSTPVFPVSIIPSTLHTHPRLHTILMRTRNWSEGMKRTFLCIQFQCHYAQKGGVQYTENIVFSLWGAYSQWMIEWMNEGRKEGRKEGRNVSNNVLRAVCGCTPVCSALWHSSAWRIFSEGRRAYAVD